MQTATSNNKQLVIIFDGVCNLCNGAVQFVIKRDKKGSINFAPLQGDYGQQLLKQHHLPMEEFNSFLLIENGKVYAQSTAALKVCKYLTGGWPLMVGFIIVPTFIRNGIYRWIAKNRYKWFGKKDACMIPTAELKSRFIQ